ncbi:MAG TPA: hypothetical protein VFG34_00425 [Sphingopyxis sp.]|nr:hypothetical protein [Sphingopyxis sp.]
MAHKSLCAFLPLLLLAGCASAPRGEIYNRPLAANPSAFVAADMGFARLAQEKGQLAAYRELAHGDAQALTPAPRPVREWLRGETEPAEVMRWQAHSVFVSCDGNIGVTHGAWQAGDQQGAYTTLWQRDHKGRLTWRLDQRSPLAMAPEAPDYIATRQASCSPRPPADAVGVGSGPSSGQSADNSLRWSWAAAGNEAGHLSVQLWDGGQMVEVLPAQAKLP